MFVDFENREQWLQWRRGGIGSSDAVVLAAQAGLIKRPDWMEAVADQALFWEKTGLGKQKAENEAMRRGRELEEPARRLAETKLGFISPVNIEREDYPWLRASLDGLTLDDEIIEIKVPNEHVIQMAKDGEVVEYYRPQLAHQLMALHGHPDGWSGEERVHFVVYDFHQVHIVTKRSTDFRALARGLFEAEQRFWQHVQARQPVVGGFAWYELAMKLSDIKTDMALCDAYKDMVREAVQKYGYEPAHFYVRRCEARVSQRVDWEAVVSSCAVSEDVINAFRAEPSWVLVGGARDAQVKPLAAADAESRCLEHRRSKEEYELLLASAKNMADEHGELVGPYGMRVYKRAGSVAYAQLAKQLQIDPAIIEAHTQRVISPGYIMLVASEKKSRKEALAA